MEGEKTLSRYASVKRIRTHKKVKEKERKKESQVKNPINIELNRKLSKEGMQGTRDVLPVQSNGLIQSAHVQLLAPSWWLATICHCSSALLFMGSTHLAHMHTCRQNTHNHTIKIK